ncbi:SGNH/GDSL hydrolase family protein [Hymenobacter sp. 5516J-16]|uniref:SGNH/GDSL hydrolase family protein n=1 Tax=Hymenobacter sp. 5516J-16 TaxID=2932253 RepID=UPI001FD5949E|nr:SGNH/GDSL hydrolase family protein [Hymenobacter sp. 5516J-16]UOQ75800.1 SGNH/GDSL hydrolase family protein [Hymenobacter sp. 5516J-16]
MRWVRAGALLLLFTVAAHHSRAQTPAINPAQWAAELRAFARQDSLAPPPRRPILFYGSSSIRKWETLRQDFPGQPVLNRGFGGSRFPDALYFFDKLVVAYQPRQVVLYEGDNDIGSGATAQEVFQSFLAFEKLMQRKLPKVPLVFLAIKPSPSRWALYPKVQEANRLIREYIAAHPKRLRFMDVATPMLGPNGRPRPELFVADSLHMTPAGYELWKGVMQPLISKP